MASKPATQEDTRLGNDTDEKALLHDFVYRDDMSLNEVAEYLNTDWDDAFNKLNDQLRQAKDDDD